MSDLTGGIIETILKILVVLLIFSALAGFGTYLERKVLGFFHKLCGTLWLIAGCCRWD